MSRYVVYFYSTALYCTLFAALLHFKSALLWIVFLHRLSVARKKPAVSVCLWWQEEERDGLWSWHRVCGGRCITAQHLQSAGIVMTSHHGPSRVHCEHTFQTICSDGIHILSSLSALSSRSQALILFSLLIFSFWVVSCEANSDIFVSQPGSQH